MSCGKEINLRALQILRNDALSCKKILKHYKKLYQLECENSRKLSNKLMQYKQRNDEILIQLKTLRDDLKKYEKEKGKKLVRKRKAWHEIQHECTKRRRFAHYKHLIFSTLMEIEDCHRAEVIMWIHDNKVRFSWSPKDLKCQEENSHTRHDDSYQVAHIQHDHNYACPEVDIMAEEDTYADIDYSEIYDSQGQWQVKHMRRLVHVLDCFRISHEAYHEIRMVSKGHLPPIWRLAVQKKIMSDQIPYIKHPTVSSNTN